MKLSIVTWNCEGPLYCGKEFETEKWVKSKLPYIKNFYSNADIYAVQECSQIWSDSWNCKFKEWHGDSINLGERGLGLFSNTYAFSRLNAVDVDKYRYFIPYIVYDKSSMPQFILIHIWTKDLDIRGKKYHGYIKQVYDAINDDDYIKTITNTKLDILCVGDFNFGWKYPRNIKEAEKFYNFMWNKLGVKPLNNFNTSPYTYNRTFFNDCCLASANWHLTSSCKYGDYNESDHCPVLFELEK